MSVKERLPEIKENGESDVVLCSWAGHDGKPRVDAFALCCDSDGCLWGIADGLDEYASVATDDDYQITHWMPVPKPVAT